MECSETIRFDETHTAPSATIPVWPSRSFSGSKICEGAAGRTSLYVEYYIALDDFDNGFVRGREGWPFLVAIIFLYSVLACRANLEPGGWFWHRKQINLSGDVIWPNK